MIWISILAVLVVFIVGYAARIAGEKIYNICNRVCVNNSALASIVCYLTSLFLLASIVSVAIIKGNLHVFTLAWVVFFGTISGYKRVRKNQSYRS